MKRGSELARKLAPCPACLASITTCPSLMAEKKQKITFYFLSFPLFIFTFSCLQCEADGRGGGGIACMQSLLSLWGLLVMLQM